MLGGVIGLGLAKLIPSRKGRFIRPQETAEMSNGEVTLENFTNVPQLNERDFRPSDTTAMTMGCMLLWFGW